MKDFSLPVPNMKKEHFIQECLEDYHNVAEENDLSVEKAKMFFETNYSLLNEDQQKGFDTSNRDGLLIFLYAPGGAGKTFTLNVLVTWMITQDLNGSNLYCFRNSCYSSLSWPTYPSQIQTSSHPPQEFSLQLQEGIRNRKVSL